MKFFSRITLLFIAAAVFPAAFLRCAQTPVVENQYDYLTEGQAAAQAERFFNVNTDEMGPALFMVAQGSFWTIKDVQNALLALEVMSDKRQVNKVFNDLKKFIAQGPEKHLEESLLKNTIASTLRGLGQQGHAVTDFSDWRVCVDGIAPAFTHADSIAWLKGFIDPWVVAPKSKTIVLSKQLAADQRSAAMIQRKKFEEIPFPFLYRLKETKAGAGFPLKKTLFYAAVLYGAWRVKRVVATRLADYTDTVKDMEASAPVIEVSTRNFHLAGPAVAMYCVDPATRLVESNGSLTLKVKRPNNVNCNAAGAFWTFEQFAEYKKQLFSKREALESLYTKLFGAGQPSVEIMQHRMDCVLKLLVPSVDYDPFDKWVKFSALFNKDRKFLHLSDNGKELRWLYRWAWFYARTDLNAQCEQSLLGADLSPDDIPKRLYADVEKLVQKSMRELKVEPTLFSAVANDASLQKKSVVFRDPRPAAAVELLRLFELYSDFSDNKSSRLWTQNLYHQMPFWSVLYNPVTMAGRCSPYVFDGITIKLRSQEPSFTDHFVIAARAKQCYPYAYFGFRKKPEGAAGAGLGSGSGLGSTAVRGAAGVPRRRAHSVPATYVEPACRTSVDCKVCDIVAFTSVRDEAVWTAYDSHLAHRRVVSVTPQGKITFVGAPYTALSKAPRGLSGDIFIFQPAKCTPEQMTEFNQWIATQISWSNSMHPGQISESGLPLLDENPQFWLSLKKIARDTKCAFEVVSIRKSVKSIDRMFVYLCCKTSVDAESLKAYLKDTGLIPATAAP